MLVGSSGCSLGVVISINRVRSGRGKDHYPVLIRLVRMDVTCTESLLGVTGDLVGLLEAVWLGDVPVMVHEQTGYDGNGTGLRARGSPFFL